MLTTAGIASLSIGAREGTPPCPTGSAAAARVETAVPAVTDDGAPDIMKAAATTEADTASGATIFMSI